MVADTAGSPPGFSSLGLHLRKPIGVVGGTNKVNHHWNKKRKETNQRGQSGHLAVANADRALQVPTGGGQLLQLVKGEAEAAAVGASGWGAGLHHDGQLLHRGAGALGVHQALLHFKGEDDAAQSLARNLHRR